MAQVAQVKEALAGAQKPAAEKPEEVRARFDQWLKESREDLARIDAEGASNALPPSISQAEVDDRRQDLEQIILTIPRLLKNLDSNAEAKKALEASKNSNTTSEVIGGGPNTKGKPRTKPKSQNRVARQRDKKQKAQVRGRETERQLRRDIERR